MNAPTVKLNKNKNVGETMVLIGDLLNEVDSTGAFHKIDARRQHNYTISPRHFRNIAQDRNVWIA
eukprot:scaffold225632_cov51-Attheya_sp.AAC.1